MTRRTRRNAGLAWGGNLSNVVAGSWQLYMEDPEPPPSGPPELTAEPVYGFRVWGTENLDLTGYFRSDTTWPVREPMVSRHDHGYSGLASSHYSSHCTPGEPCATCGIYALHTYDQLSRLTNRSVGWSTTAPLEIRGLVAGWGTMRLASRGWRAGMAYPLAFLDWHVSPLYVEDGIDLHYRFHRVASRYGVPIVSSGRELLEVAREAGCVAPINWREQ